MKNRIIEIRKENGLSQAKFAEKLHLSRNFIGLVESGERNVSDRTINDICTEFAINETWLRTGKGEKTAPADREQEIAQITAQMYRENDSFRTELIKMISQLSDEQMEVLRDFAIQLGEKAKK